MPSTTWSRNFFVVVYQGILQMPYLEGLLEAVAKKFLDQVVEGMGRLADVFGNGLSVKRVDFDKDFKATLEKIDMKQRELRRGGSAIKSFADTSKGKEITKKQGKPAADSAADDKSKKSKQQRVWDTKGKVSNSVMTSLDHSKTKDMADADDDDEAFLAKKKEFLGSGESDVDGDDVASLSPDGEEDEPAEKAGRVG